MKMFRVRPPMYGVVVALALATASCGSASSTDSSGSSPTLPNTFVLREWSVTAPAEVIHAGSVAVTASNRGNETHELVIVHASSATSLPAKSDGSLDEDKIAETDKVGEIANVPSGKNATKTFDLPAGDYIALCNTVDQMSSGNGGMGNGGMSGNGMSGTGMGHVHYTLGMVTKFTVI